MVIDATIRVTYHAENDENATAEENLYPARHQMTLPINSINNIFSGCEIAFNHHTKLDVDRYVICVIVPTTTTAKFCLLQKLFPRL